MPTASPGPSGKARAYWSERNGRRPAPGLTPAQLRRLFASLVVECENRSELQEHFGYECVDEGHVPGSSAARSTNG